MNQNFEEKKQKYFNELIKYSNELSKASTIPKYKVLLDILLKPKTNLDLECIKAYILWQESLHKLCENIRNENQNANENDNLYQKWFSEITTAISQNKSLKEIDEINKFYHLEDPWNYAEYMLDFAFATLNNKPYEIISKIYKTQNNDEIRKYASLIFNYQSKLSIPDPMFLKSRNDSEINNFIDYIYCFSSVVDEKFKSKNK